MYDYSKRRGPLKDQQLPDEQEQFTNEWNLALNHLDDENDPSLVLLKNFFSLDTRLSETKPIDINSDRLDSQMIKLKKSLSELDLTCENELKMIM
ncbi:unnamed protein product [Brachionus calyciflorus]|uniref:Uncharacterized protein n=1 Tax=Brachionus calyciflorus TaxID=104777 RepID=A0A813SR44_9BILA|nr:unnamed protein product [Brachionus calyciflorus]